MLFLLFSCVFVKTYSVSAASEFDKCFKNIYRQYVKSSGVLRKDIKLRTNFPNPHSMINYAKNNNFPKLYSNLVRGLNKESVNVVNRILVRLKMATDKKRRWDGVTSDEARQLLKLRKEFKIKKINDNCFAWKDYLLPINHFGPEVFFYNNGIMNFNNLDIFKNKDIVDAGAYIGDSAIVFSKYTNKNVYSFEPSSQHYELMKKTIEMNKKTNIIPVHLGLGSKNQKARIPLGIDMGLRTDQTNINKFSDKNTEVVNITTLDDYAKKHDLDVGLIKVDVEGNEQDFLKGAMQTIKTQKPCLLISIYHNPSDFFNIKPMIESWDLGYNFQITKFGEHICCEALLVCTPPGV